MRRFPRVGYAVRSDEAYENSIGCLPTASSNQLQHMINLPFIAANCLHTASTYNYLLLL